MIRRMPAGEPAGDYEAPSQLRVFNPYSWRKPPILKRKVTELEAAMPRKYFGEPLPTDSRLTYVPRGAVTNDNQKIVLASPAIDLTGSIPPAVSSLGFRYITTIDSIHLFWNGENESDIPLQRRADGFKEPVPPGEMLIEHLPAGLPGVPGQRLYLWPFWIPGTCTLGWIPGDLGQPRFAHSQVTAEAAHKQALAGREAFGSPLTVQLAMVPLPPLPDEPPPPPPEPVPTQPTAPPPAPTPTDPDPDPREPPTCVMHGTEIVPIGHSEWWTQQMPQNEWHRIVLASAAGTLNLNATPDHRIYTGRAGLTEMRDVRKKDWLATYLGEMEVIESFAFKRAGYKDCVHMEHGHLYWANGILSHNIKIGALR